MSGLVRAIRQLVSETEPRKCCPQDTVLTGHVVPVQGVKPDWQGEPEGGKGKAEDGLLLLLLSAGIPAMPRTRPPT